MRRASSRNAGSSSTMSIDRSMRSDHRTGKLALG
jgi:hypothetical protein